MTWHPNEAGALLRRRGVPPPVAGEWQTSFVDLVFDLAPYVRDGEQTAVLEEMLDSPGAEAIDAAFRMGGRRAVEMLVRAHLGMPEAIP